MEFRNVFYLLFTGFVALAGCDGKETSGAPVVYDGPMLEGDSVRYLYSDSAIVKVIVEAPKQFQFNDGDQEFPEGIFIQFFDPDGTRTSTLKADHGYLFNDEKRYTGVGNVHYEGFKEKQTLLTDTLHWSQPEEKVYTKARVIIIEETDTLRGQGMEAAQDFSTYTILKSEGSKVMEETPVENTEESADEAN